MKPKGVLRGACVLLALVLYLTSFVSSVCAAEDNSVRFSLTAQNALKGRLVDFTLSAHNANGLSAVVAKVEYNGDLLGYRKIKSLNDGVQYTTGENNGNSFKVCIALSPQSVVVSSQNLIQLSFKAETVGKADVLFRVIQAVTSDGREISVSSPKAEISVSKSPATEKAMTDTVQSSTEGSTYDEVLTVGRKRLSGRVSVTALVLILVLGVTAVAVSVFVILYKSGRIKFNKNKSEVPLWKPSDNDK